MTTSPAVRRERFAWADLNGVRLSGIRLRVPQPRYPVALVFLHEGLGSVAQWRDFPDGLCVRLGLDGFAYDRAGYGQSDPPLVPRTPRYLHDEAWGVLPQVLDAAGIAKAILVGHSDGGTIALLFAARHGDRVAAVITEAAHVFVEPETLNGIAAAVAAWRTTDLPQRLARHHGDKAEALFFAWADTWLAPDFRHWNIEADIAGMSCPMLLIQGAADKYGTSAQLDAIAAQSRGPIGRLLLPGVGHTPHREAPEATSGAMAAFVEQHVLTAGSA